MGIVPQPEGNRNPLQEKTKITGKKSRRALHPAFTGILSSELSPAQRAVYNGRDRIGAYRRYREFWIALDRFGRPLGRYQTEIEAASAITASRSS
jgi:hypothetical protein